MPPYSVAMHTSLASREISMSNMHPRQTHTPRTHTAGASGGNVKVDCVLRGGPATGRLLGTAGYLVNTADMTGFAGQGLRIERVVPCE